MVDDFVRDARKGKAKLEEEDTDPKSLLPKPVPKGYSYLGSDAIYLKLVGPPRDYEAVRIGSPEPVQKIQFRFRNKEITRILGEDDARINNIQTVSGATIGILSDSATKFHRQLFLELVGTADEVKIAELLITDVISEAYERPFVPKALMPTNICHYAIPILVTQVIPLLGINCRNTLKLEAESRTWIEVDTYPPEGKILDRMVNVYGQGLDVSNAIVMIKDRISAYEESIKVRSELIVEEIGSDDESGNMEVEEQEDVEEDDFGVNECGDELGNEIEGFMNI